MGTDLKNLNLYFVMSTYYIFKGKLTFETPELAQIAFDYLIQEEKCYFFIPEQNRNDPSFSKTLFLKGNTLQIEDENFGSGGIYDTADCIANVIGIAKSGKVVFQDGDDENDAYYLNPSYELKNKLGL
ncbi:hypothetical protein AD998_01385 [bacterium 336/3]|nr:hypothetical protein AD998_01385 [bacterium 336/3]